VLVGGRKKADRESEKERLLTEREGKESERKR
jgi:hypothetical protein